MTRERIEDVTEAIVGRRYLVPSLLVTPRNSSYLPFIAPMLGSLHHDEEIGAPALHWHYDERFLTDAMIRAIAPESPESTPNEMLNAAFLVMFPETTGGDRLGRSDYREVRDSPACVPVHRAFRCVRPFLKRQGHAGTTALFRAIENRYENHKVTAICPHKGTLLTSVPPDRDNCITCPAHGLRWSCRTGRIVRKTRRVD